MSLSLCVSMSGVNLFNLKLDVTRVLQGCLLGVSIVLQGYSKSVLRVFQGFSAYCVSPGLEYLTAFSCVSAHTVSCMKLQAVMQWQLNLSHLFLAIWGNLSLWWSLNYTARVSHRFLCMLHRKFCQFFCKMLNFNSEPRTKILAHFKDSDGDIAFLKFYFPLMEIVATTSLPAVDRPNSDRWNAAI